MTDIFISYSHQDRERATKIARALTARHHSVWTDQEIRAGQNWQSEIEHALSEAKVFVLCVSPQFLASDWAQFEIGVALSRSREQGVQVIPLILRESEVPSALSRFPYLDARQKSADEVATSIQKAVETSMKNISRLESGDPVIPRTDALERFTAACQAVLGRKFSKHKAELLHWFGAHLSALGNDLDNFISELERSVAATPAGKLRTAVGQKKSEASILWRFLESLVRKYADRP